LVHRYECFGGTCCLHLQGRSEPTGEKYYVICGKKCWDWGNEWTNGNKCPGKGFFPRGESRNIRSGKEVKRLMK
jgi:hypothetical protein